MTLGRELLDAELLEEQAAGTFAPPPPGKPLFTTIDTAIGWITEIPAAILVVVDTLVLLFGVISRYVFSNPYAWTGELAEWLFLWLAMFGAVIALRRGEHMRMTAMVSRLRPQVRAWLETVVTLVIALFLGLILFPAQGYVATQWGILSPSMGLHDSFRVSGLLVAIALMLIITLLRLIERASVKTLSSAVLVVGAIAGALWLARPMLIGLGNGNLLVFFVGLVGLCVLIGTPIAFCFGIASIAYFSIAGSIPLSIVVGRLDGGTSNFVLTAIPLFIWLGYLMDAAGLARVLVGFISALVGHVRGGLSYVLLGAMFLVSGISGAKSADMAAIAPVLLPEMKRRGVAPGELIALLASSGAMSETIPPSVVLIIIGSVTGVSIAGLFTGGLLPAVVAALALVVVVYLRSRSDTTSTVDARASWNAILRSTVVALPALVLPLLIRAAVVKGVATATEVGTIGVVYTILAGVIVYREFDFRRLYPMLVETAALSGAILLIIATATVMAWALTQSGFAQQLVQVMAKVPGGAAGFMAISVVAFIVLGCLLEGIPVIVLFGPLLFPVALSFGINEIHYAIVVILAMGIGLFAPPVGVGFYTACVIGRCSPDQAMWRVFPYLGAVAVALIIVAAVPWLSTGFLPVQR